ncbi:hypothetical protein BEP19_02625 [Ammoniphilus oxalaticus]|uniref:Fe/B12 periplasmic-binding domain-containing protein n=1 Tax=Ammoniphilus oxalaticus TaxID=66863 RepID=A0A419SNK5_9BACL|nr:ABC transporter substrate-binding protein [Ammoniphilus oxalaticus]RKD25847.1 hypothetical protein BEP19_02625 [Ammoniphilus oxalaticus]
MVKHSKRYFLTFFILVSMVVSACSGGAKQAGTDAGEQATKSVETTREIVDMADRTVTIPAEINKVVLIGPVPVLSTFVLAVGEGDKIINGLPESFAKQNRWKYLPKFAPNLGTEPTMQGESRDPNIEEILLAAPDIVFSMDDQVVKQLEENGLTAIYLTWKEPEEVKETIKLVGEIFNKQAEAKAYATYFDETIAKIKAVTNQIPENERVTALNTNFTNLSQPHEIAEWWIEQAGGISVTDESAEVANKGFTVEQLLQWDPDVIIVAKPSEIEDLKQDVRFQTLKAVKNDRIYSTPLGAHIWANRTSEQPLMVLFAAKHMYPDLFENVDLEREVMNFYQTFFQYDLTEEEAKEILAGK